MTATTLPLSGADARAAAKSAAIPWYLAAVLLSSTFIAVGLLWDISWHQSVGRDSFWTLPHLLEQLGAFIAGTSCGWVVLHTTFAGSPEARSESVRFWGFRGPLGAWVCIWGTLVMITSAPFDNWWHNAYGLDVMIISPPHMVLALGMNSLQFGAMLMALAPMNRATDPAETKRLGWCYAYAAGVLVCMITILISEYSSDPNNWHNALFYKVTAGALTLFLVASARGSRLAWPATSTAAIAMGIILALMWILPLFPATPKLAPIYNPVTRMVPPHFPLLLIAPAFVIDLLMRRTGRNHDWRLALAIGVSFVAVMLVVHWFFAEFMLSPWARNAFFMADQWPYEAKLGPWRYEYWGLDVDANGAWSAARFATGLVIATVLGFASARIGLWWGNGMARVRR